jgi:hypothetical protein
MKTKAKVLCVLLLLQCTLGITQEFTIPAISDLPRIDRQSPRPAMAILRNSAFILKLKHHAPLGGGYVIITDHTDDQYIAALRDLAEYRRAKIIHVPDLGEIYQTDILTTVRKQLMDLKPQFVAIAPRLESYRENMLLGMWELLSTLDDDKYLDAYPGVLLASDAKSFAALIQRSIKFQSITQKQLKPMAISQVPSNQESRSLQKAGILRNVFSTYGLQTPTIAIYTPTADDAPHLSGSQTWNIQMKNKGDFIKKFEPAAATALAEASLVIMHGHGSPGMSCSVDIDGILTRSNNQLVLSGSCFAAAPVKTDFPKMTRIPGGYAVTPRQSFSTRYIDRGATVFFGHMRLSSGFPHLYPVLEKWMQGKSVGESYQQLVNALMDMRGFGPGKFVVTEAAPGQRGVPQNTLLYVIIGDPALIPLQPLEKINEK